jgi:hypothetical protein
MASRDDCFGLSTGASQTPAAPGDLPGLGGLRERFHFARGCARLSRAVGV